MGKFRATNDGDCAECGVSIFEGDLMGVDDGRPICSNCYDGPPDVAMSPDQVEALKKRQWSWLDT